MSLRDYLTIYDDNWNPPVDGAIAANTWQELNVLDAAQYVFLLERMYIWPPYDIFGAPADLKDIQVLIDGGEYPSTPGRLHIRGRADRNMATPYDQRYAVKNIGFGEISVDPVKDTVIKVTPAQKVSVRIQAGAAGIAATDSQIRIILAGRIAETDADLQAIYGGAQTYGVGSRQLADPISGKVTPPISKSFPITIDNAKYFSGATGQTAPKIFPFWTWSRNSVAIPDTPEYEFSYRQPAHVAESFNDLRFDWTRTIDQALVIRHLGAIINLGGGRVWLDQPPYRRPGHKNLYYGYIVDSAFPNLLPAGGDVGLTPMFEGPLDLEYVKPKILCHNNLTELRAVANAGTTIAINDLEVQVRGTHIQF